MVECDSCKTTCQVNLALTVDRPNQAWREADEIHAKQKKNKFGKEISNKQNPDNQFLKVKKTSTTENTP